MTRKAKIHQFILGNRNATYEQWVVFQKEEPTLRLKKVGKTGVLINLSKADGWIDPQSWDNNYVAGLQIHVNQAIEEFLEANFQVTDLPQINAVVQGLQQELAKCQEDRNRQIRSCERSTEILQRLGEVILELFWMVSREGEDCELTGRSVVESLIQTFNPNRTLDENVQSLQRFVSS